MAQGRDFLIRRFPLYDITIYDLNAQSTNVLSPVTGSLGASGDNTYVSVTANTIPGGTSALPSGMAADGCYAEVVAPVVRNGGATVYPDFAWTPRPDETDLSSPAPAARFFADGSYGGNLFPPQNVTVGRVRALTIGVPLIQILNDVKNGSRVGSMALKATGWKYLSTFQCGLFSKRGWGASVSGDTVLTPGRITIWGPRYTDAILAPFAQYWNGAFTRTSLRRYLEQQQVPMMIAGTQGGTVSVADLPTLSGGYNQKGDIVFRDVRFASNLAATGTSAPYSLTNSQSAGGGSGQVDTQYGADLGWPFAPVNGRASAARSAIILQKLGFVPGVANIAYGGLNYGGQYVPDPAGWPIGQNVDLLAYGNVQPLRGESELYYPLPDLDDEMDVFGENASVFVTANGTAIAATAARAATAGVAIQLSGAVNPGRQGAA